MPNFCSQYPLDEPFLDELCSVGAKIVMKHWLDSSQQRELGNKGDAVFNSEQRHLEYPALRLLSCLWSLPPFMQYANSSKPGSSYIYWKTCLESGPMSLFQNFWNTTSSEKFTEIKWKWKNGLPYSATLK